MLLPSLALLGEGKEDELAERTNPKESRRFKCHDEHVREPLPLYGAGGFPGNVGNHIATPLQSGKSNFHVGEKIDGGKCVN